MKHFSNYVATFDTENKGEESAQPMEMGTRQQREVVSLLLCNAVACPHLERSGISTACSRSASAHLYHAGSRLLQCDGAAD